MRNILAALIIALLAPLASVADNCPNLPAPSVLPWNGLEAVPRMGYSTWYDQFTSPDQTHILAQSGLLTSLGYQAVGYTWVDVDDGWAGGRTAGTIYPNATNFASGMASLAASIHAAGQKFGIYSSPYTTTCDGFTGSGTYESNDANTFASWGADYLKYDGCSVNLLYPSCYSTSYQQVWQLMAQDIRATGRSIVMELGSTPAPVGSGYSGYDMNTNIQWGGNVGMNEVYFTSTNLFGSGGVGWPTFLAYVPFATGLYKWEKPGYFPDCDFLTGPTLNAHFTSAKFTTAQSQTQFALYALWGCPLIISEDLSTIGATLQGYYQNTGVIAVNQDTLAHAAVLYSQRPCGSSGSLGNCQVWVKPLHDGSWAFGLINLHGTAAHTIAVNFSNFGGSPDVHDLWAGTDLGTMSSYTVSVPLNGSVMLKVIPAAGAAHTITNTQLENAAIH